MSNDFAQEVSDYLVECGHDVTLLDLLDAFAVLGLKLVGDPTGASSDAYLEAVSEAVGGVES